MLASDKTLGIRKENYKTTNFEIYFFLNKELFHRLGFLNSR